MIQRTRVRLPLEEARIYITAFFSNDQLVIHNYRMWRVVAVGGCATNNDIVAELESL
jgi:hypothetical protein